MNTVLEALRGGLIVSCQAYPGEPLREPDIMARVASAAEAGGAVGVRVQGLDDIAMTRKRVGVPVIGLWKDGTEPVFITPTLGHARAVRDADADVVALDGTRRQRPDGLDLAQTIAALRADGDVLVMADCGCLDDAVAARDAGADLVGTTLAGYTADRPKTTGPDLELIHAIARRLPDVPVIAEGRVHTPAQARRAVEAGAFAVVVGTAITHPTTITGWFADSVRSAADSQPPGPRP